MMQLITVLGKIISKIYYYIIIFFPDTAYKLLGFFQEENSLFAVVEQAYVTIDMNTDLEKVKAFMESNGFINTRNHDYFNPTLGIILENLHDENVLTRNKIHYIIVTVFYLTEDFWAKDPNQPNY
ncbi:hypothetical protein MM236_13775 [Belliella sp. DSM 107340]|uniref:Uncharacterized protein n=1 Tax=Belliella calami TaxID=2923436 RepID=A0ABS9URL0_9BACT|nr:hypothetical protein [Belliella calami]MCH7399069.1 hypothetical protein [Belliella calami]